MFKMEKRITFSCFEKKIFKELVVQRPSIHKNNTRRSNSVIEEKNAAWREIVNDFNSVSGVTKRNEKQLRKLWQNLKQDRKAVFKVARQASHTGRGQPNPQGKNDSELHQYLLQKVKAEAELATFQLNNAKKIAEEEAIKKRLLYESEVAHLAEKRKLELKILYNKLEEFDHKNDHE